jgi:hypothetical protein
MPQVTDRESIEVRALHALVVAYHDIYNHVDWIDAVDKMLPLIEEMTGDRVKEPCPTCKGRGEVADRRLWPTRPAFRWGPCRRCDGKGYLTAENLERECPFCGEDDPKKLTYIPGVTLSGWICHSPDCGREADERRGVIPGDPTGREVA